MAGLVCQHARHALHRDLLDQSGRRHLQEVAATTETEVQNWPEMGPAASTASTLAAHHGPEAPPGASTRYAGGRSKGRARRLTRTPETGAPRARATGEQLKRSGKRQLCLFPACGTPTRCPGASGPSDRLRLPSLHHGLQLHLRWARRVARPVKPRSARQTWVPAGPVCFSMPRRQTSAAW